MALALLNTTSLPLPSIRTDGGTQSRTYLNHVVVDGYAEDMVAGAEFPPIVVYHDGSQYWLADGFHRLAAWRKAHMEIPIPADVRQGTRRDAILHSVGANSTHGLPRTNEDKRRAVLHLLEDAEWSTWSDREIARRCNVSDKTVGHIRKHLTAGIRSDAQLTERTYTTKHGTTATMQTGNIGKRAEPEAPVLSSRENLMVATQTGQNEPRGQVFATSEPKPYSPHAILPSGHSPTWNGARVEMTAEEDEETPITGLERVKIARVWLNDYRNRDGITWRGLSENQITHANSPCYQEFCKAYPGIEQPKIVLSSALFDLRQANKENRPEAEEHPFRHTDADHRREIIQTAVEDCQRILSRPAYLDAIAHASRDTQQEHDLQIAGLRHLLYLSAK